jgi:hypothetical protein
MATAQNVQVRIAATACRFMIVEDLHARNVRILRDHETGAAGHRAQCPAPQIAVPGTQIAVPGTRVMHGTIIWWTATGM